MFINVYKKRVLQEKRKNYIFIKKEMNNTQLSTFYS